MTTRWFAEPLPPHKVFHINQEARSIVGMFMLSQELTLAPEPDLIL